MKARSTKKALVMSMLSMLLCITMLAGTTFAWFTDSVSSANNIIVAGNLDVELKYAKIDGGTLTGWDTVGGKDNVFDKNARWEPGRVEVVYLEVANLGSLALKYQLSVNVANEKDGTNVAGQNFKLSDHLVFKVVELDAIPTTPYTREEAIKAAGTVKGLKDYNGETTPLEVEGTDYVALIVYMPESVGNEANYRGDAIPQIELGINLVATQLAAEEDSFGPDYDKDAWGEKFKVMDAADLTAALENAKDGDVIEFAANIESVDGLLITDKKITIDLNGHTHTVSEGASTSNRNFKINGTSEVTFKNGTMVAAGTMTAGAYGTIRTEGSAKVTLDNVKLYNYRGNGLNVKALGGTTVVINNSEIYSEYGGGVEAAGGIVELNNVKIDQKGMWAAPYNSMAVSVNGGGKATINSGVYSTACLTKEEANNQGTSHGPWTVGVLNSGGTLVINGGTFSNDNFGDNSLATYARGLVLADTGANVVINGGTFNAMKAIVDVTNNLGDTTRNPSVTLSGGSFSADPAVSGLHASYLITVADGYETIDNGNGTYTVLPDIEDVDTSFHAASGLYWNGNTAYHKGVFYVFNADELLKAAAYFVYQNHSNEANRVTIKLMADIDMAGVAWSPFNVMFVTIDGNGHTVSNLSNSLFNYAGAVVINDLTLENVTATGNQAGAFAAGTEGATFTNCFLKGDNTITYKEDPDDAAHGVGAISGVTINSNLNVTIAEGATVTLDMGMIADTAKTTFESYLYGYKHTTYGTNTGAIVNNGTLYVVKSVATAAQLQAGLNAATGNMIFVLTDDIAGTVNFAQNVDANVVIDGKDHTFNGNIVIKAQSGIDGKNGSITIKDVNFKTDAATLDFIASVESNYYPLNVTVDGCSFEGTGAGSGVVAIRLKSSKNFVIKNCEATKVHSLLQNTSGWNLTVENVTVTEAGRGMSLGTVQGVKITDATIEAAKYGIRMDAGYNNAAVLTDCDVTAFIPVVVRKVGVNSAVTFNGTNVMTETNTDGIWCAIGASEYEANGVFPTAATAVVTVTVNDTTLDQAGIFNNSGK